MVYQKHFLHLLVAPLLIFNNLCVVTWLESLGPNLLCNGNAVIRIKRTRVHSALREQLHELDFILCWDQISQRKLT